MLISLPYESIYLDKEYVRQNIGKTLFKAAYKVNTGLIDHIVEIKMNIKNDTVQTLYSFPALKLDLNVVDIGINVIPIAKRMNPLEINGIIDDNTYINTNIRYIIFTYQYLSDLDIFRKFYFISKVISDYCHPTK